MSGCYKVWERVSFPEPQVNYVVLTFSLNLLYEHGVRTWSENCV